MTVSLKFTVNCSLLFAGLPLLERPAAARAAGFDAVEFWWPFAQAVPPDREVDRFVTAVRDAGVTVTGLNFAAGDMSAGDRGLLSWPARSREFEDNVDVVVGLGDLLGTRCFNALYGNRVDDVAPAVQDELAAANLARAAHAAGRIGAVVLLEPVSGAERYPLLTATDAVAVIDTVQQQSDVDNLRLLADLYHLTVNGDDVDKVLDRYADRIGHVQVADAPGRHEPGTGRIDFHRHLGDLQAAGYDGWVGLEYRPSTTPHSFAWIGDF